MNKNTKLLKEQKQDNFFKLKVPSQYALDNRSQAEKNYVRIQQELYSISL